MEIKDVLSIIAILVSPLVAVQVEKYIERGRNSRNRKISIFKTLMATRGTKLSNDHVTALNQIDLEFYGKKEYLKVIHAWKEYLDQLNVKFDSEKEEEFRVWNEKSEELLANLLFEMGLPLGYNFDKVTIKRNAYSPIGHAKIENENQQIRHLLIKVLNGENAITTLQVSSDDIVKSNNDAQERQGELQKLLIEFYKNEKPLNVKVIKE